MYDSPIADMIAVLVDSKEIWLYSDEFFIKGGGSNRTPWHQDLPYWPLEGEKIASMWISLDPLPKEGCLEYIPGSHRQTRYDGFNPRRVSEDPTLPFYGEDLPPLPDIEADRDRWNIVSWPIEPGDVILAHPGVLHGGGPTAPGASVARSPSAATATTSSTPPARRPVRRCRSRPDCRSSSSRVTRSATPGTRSSARSRRARAADPAPSIR